MERNEDLLKDINYCGYWNDSNRYVIEIDKKSAVKLMARLVAIGQFKKGATLSEGLKDYFNADIIIIGNQFESRSEE